MIRTRLSATGLLLALTIAPWPSAALEVIEAAFVRCYPEAGTCEVRPQCQGCKVLRLKMTEETRLMKKEQLEALPQVVVGAADVAYRPEDDVVLWFQMLDTGEPQ